MNFAFAGERSPFLEWYGERLKSVLVANGYTFHGEPPEDVRLVLNFIDTHKPRPYRRRGQATFVIALAETGEMPADVLRAAYPLMIRSLANLMIYLVHQDGGFRTFFVTLEQGYYEVTAGSEAEYFQAIYQRVAPLACSQLVINNEFVPDLPPELWDGDETTRQLSWAGKRLDELDLLPAPFPIQELLSEREFRHVQKLYGIGGLSYGNLSARRDARTFWMSASGVDKSDLHRIGEHILLVKDYVPERNAMVLSVPPHVTPRRVSVDAIEHWMIYTEHPSVGAIVHVHAWMEGIPSTEINYPCGTLQLAQSVAELVRQAPDPSRAVIGLKNHGLTITGRDLEDIFERIEGRIVRQVPMS